MFPARKEDSFNLRVTGRHSLSRGLDAPCALSSHYRKVAAKKQGREFVLSPEHKRRFAALVADAPTHKTIVLGVA